ncbi:MAG: HAD-IB family phosphatase [Candidatus Bathyarchaeales archaeon]
MAVIGTEEHGLVVFDVEGVLIPKNRYLLFEMGRKLGFFQFLKIVFYGFLYELGLISLKSALKRMFKVFKGFKAEEFLHVFKQIPLMPDVEKVFEELRVKGWKTALISSGLPAFVVHDLAFRLKADYAFGFNLETNGGVATGEISGEVIEQGGKLLVLKRILENEGIAYEKCVVVADDRNNAPMLLPEMLKIGYNPDFLLRLKADYVVTGKLSDILPLIHGEKQKMETLPSKNEIFREVIHACGLTVPILSSLVGQHAIALLILVVTFLYAVSEVALISGKHIPIFSSIIRYAATPPELYEFATAPIFFAFGILFTLLLFPAPANSAAITIFAIGDSTAAIFGRIFGKTPLPFNKGKTLEGLIAGLLFSFLAATAYLNPLKALVGAAVALFVESLPLPINDNLVVPLITGAILSIII